MTSRSGLVPDDHGAVVVCGHATQAQIAVRAFGVTKIIINARGQALREHGPKGFYAATETAWPAVLTAEVLETGEPLAR